MTAATVACRLRPKRWNSACRPTSPRCTSWPGARLYRWTARSEQFQLRHRGEGAAVERRGAVGAQGGEVFGGAVAGVTLPAVVRMGQGVFAHQPVAVFLGDDRGGRDA